jgi:hypothetical protein
LAVALAGAVQEVQADLVTDWNSAALQAIRMERTPPPTASRSLAMLHVAIYDAANSVQEKHEEKFASYLVTKKAPGQPSEAAAASAAAHTVLASLFPGQRASFDALHAQVLANIKPGAKKSRGLAWGRQVGRLVLKVRAKDGSTNTVAYTNAPAPGVWRPTVSFGGVVRPALLPQWGAVTPFGIRSVVAYRPPPPPPLHSPQYAEEVRLTQALGETNSPLRTGEETEIAFFWANGAGTATPPGHWNIIAQGIAADFGLTFDENVRLFALLNIALADAAIACWDCKYLYNLWRPITAIQEADSAGNPGVAQNPAWQPLLFTPPFPEYTSGHSTFSAAAAEVLIGFFGRDDVPFASPSEEYPSLVRQFTGFRQAALESGWSRIYGGIHFLSGNLNALDTGARIGVEVFDKICAPQHRPKPRATTGSPAKPKK